MAMRILIILSLAMLLNANASRAESWTAQSPEKQLAVLELFTAEGCGLCPPADRWVHQLPKRGIGSDQLIVLGYHIDYLDDKKGWIDRFAKPEFSARQRQLAKLNLFQTVFTPEFFISGEVVHDWHKHAEEAIRFVNKFEPEADIKLAVSQQPKALNIAATVTVNGTENRQNSLLYLLIKQDDVISHIGGGDNIGATFNHQDLVRVLAGPFVLDQDGNSQLSTTIQLDEAWGSSKLELVAFVQNLNDGYILQGLSVPLKD